MSESSESTVICNDPDTYFYYGLFFGLYQVVFRGYTLLGVLGIKPEKIHEKHVFSPLSDLSAQTLDLMPVISKFSMGNTCEINGRHIF